MNDSNDFGDFIYKPNYHAGVKWLNSHGFYSLGTRFSREFSLPNSGVLLRVSFCYYNGTHCIEAARGKWQAAISYAVFSKMGVGDILVHGAEKRHAYTQMYHRAAFCETPQEALAEVMRIKEDVWQETKQTIVQEGLAEAAENNQKEENKK